MTMTPEWKDAATQFGLTPEDAEAHWQAWQDLERLRPEAFVDETLREFKAAAEAKRTGQPPDAATALRLQARHNIIIAMTEFASYDLVQDYLKAYDGVRH